MVCVSFLFSTVDISTFPSLDIVTPVPYTPPPAAAAAAAALDCCFSLAQLALPPYPTPSNPIRSNRIPPTLIHHVLHLFPLRPRSPRPSRRRSLHHLIPQHCPILPTSCLSYHDHHDHRSLVISAVRTNGRISLFLHHVRPGGASPAGGTRQRRTARLPPPRG